MERKDIETLAELISTKVAETYFQETKNLIAEAVKSHKVECNYGRLVWLKNTLLVAAVFAIDHISTLWSLFKKL